MKEETKVTAEEYIASKIENRRSDMDSNFRYIHHEYALEAIQLARQEEQEKAKEAKGKLEGRIANLEKRIKELESENESLKGKVKYNDVIKFASFLTGDDPDTVIQMYRDWQESERLTKKT